MKTKLFVLAVAGLLAMAERQCGDFDEPAPRCQQLWWLWLCGANLLCSGSVVLRSGCPDLPRRPDVLRGPDVLREVLPPSPVARLHPQPVQEVVLPVDLRWLRRAELLRCSDVLRCSGRSQLLRRPGCSQLLRSGPDLLRIVLLQAGLPSSPPAQVDRQLVRA